MGGGWRVSFEILDVKCKFGLEYLGKKVMSYVLLIMIFGYLWVSFGNLIIFIFI